MVSWRIQIIPALSFLSWIYRFIDSQHTDSNMGKSDKSSVGGVDELFNKFVDLRKSGLTKCVKDVSIARGFRSLKFRKPEIQKMDRKSNIIIAFLIIVIAFLCTQTIFFEEVMYEYVYSPKCLVDNNALVMEAARPKMYCKICENFKSVPTVYNISKEEFVREYAYTGIPVLIKESTRNWTALDKFSFHYLRDLYRDTPGALTDDEQCQFFPYKTDFKILKEAFEMADERVRMDPGEETWYFGWSNCHPSVGQKLRRHYERPYFLPDNAESSVTDWIFMGWSGLGAFLHIDYVQRPSWQAQISGRKQWLLVPPPECEHVCSSMNVTVEKGDIFVVDTNLWYHETTVQPGDLSIAIGSEYD